MSIDIAKDLKEITSGKALSLINSFIEESREKVDSNEWLYLYEILYLRLRDSEYKDLGFAEAAIAILQHLENSNNSKLNSYLTQELNLRVLLIKRNGVREGVLNPESVYESVKPIINILSPESVESRSLSQVSNDEIVIYRNIKNLLTPIVLLREIGIESEYFSSWLKVYEKLP